MDMNELKEKILEAEYKLLDPQIRGSKEKLSHLLAPNMCEIGRSGKFYDRECIIDSLSEDPGGDDVMTIQNFNLQALSESICFVTYEISEDESLRSSIWKKYGEDWKMAFHQGTPRHK